MQLLSAETRTHNLARLGSEAFDVLVIGGGITGAGVALDAVARGYKVALVEKIDFASGTSSKSTKLVHGGIRYLPNFDFALVHEALIERGLLVQNAPYLVSPVPFILPIYEGDRHPVGMPFTTPGGIGLSYLLDIGLWLYDGLAGRRNLHRHRRISREAVEKMAPTLVTRGLKEGFIYYDAQTNDARLTMAIIRTAAQFGAVIANYAEVTSFVKENGKIQGATIYDRTGEQNVTIRARHVINATGIFSDQLEALTGDEPEVTVVPSKGIHLVFSRQDLEVGDSAIVLPETDDKRILFIVPWESRAILGTTDTGSGDLDNPTASPEDVKYLLDHLNRYLSVNLTADDIISTYAGYRPLVKPRKEGKGQSSAKLSRTHVVLQDDSGLVSIVGGKLTTYRLMAQDTVDVLSKRDNTKPVHPTEQLPLYGSAGWAVRQRDLAYRGASLGLDSDDIVHLGHSYGTEADAVMDLIADNPTLAERLIEDLPYLKAEVIHACRQEMAMTPYDILARRTSITLEDRDRGLGIVKDVAAMMAQELDWTSEYTQSMVNAYRSSIQYQIDAEVGV
jgi:glycerol-3-phosphate dehydrogenase